MTTQELHELDAWIAENVYGARVYKSGRGSICAMFNVNTMNECDRIIEAKHPWDNASFNPTEDPTSAMDVLKKCAEKNMLGIAIDALGGQVEIWTLAAPQVTRVCEETLELCICKIAKQLFSQTTK